MSYLQGLFREGRLHRQRGQPIRFSAAMVRCSRFLARALASHSSLTEQSTTLSHVSLCSHESGQRPPAPAWLQQGLHGELG